MSIETAHWSWSFLPLLRGARGVLDLTVIRRNPLNPPCEGGSTTTSSTSDQLLSIEEALKRGMSLLTKSSNSPRLDAEWLLLEVIDADNSSYLIAHRDEELSPLQEREFFKMVERRSKGEPMAYILGWWEFLGRRFKISPAVLVPRPATESLVEKALEKIKVMNNSLGRLVTVADIGTGSGCLAISLLLERGNCELIATDVSDEALMVARENARSYGLENRIEFAKEDIRKTLLNPKIDLIVSNPPYVPSGEVDRAYQSPTPETAGLGFEPRLALDGGSDGLDLVRVIQKSGRPYIIETVGGNIIEG